MSHNIKKKNKFDKGIKFGLSFKSDVTHYKTYPKISF